MPYYVILDVIFMSSKSQMSLRVILTDHLRESRLVNDRLIFAAFFAIILFMIVIVQLVVLQIM